MWWVNPHQRLATSMGGLDGTNSSPSEATLLSSFSPEMDTDTVGATEKTTQEPLHKVPESTTTMPLELDPVQSEGPQEPTEVVPLPSTTPTRGPFDLMQLLATEEVKSLMPVLIHPLQQSKHGYDNNLLGRQRLNIAGQHFLDPTTVLMSTIRAMYVIKHTLQEDGHVYVMCGNPLLKPLVREVALCCTNPNMWFHVEGWKKGTITNAKVLRRLFLGRHQPNRSLFRSKGIKMVNVHCPNPAALGHNPPPKVDWSDRWELFKDYRQRNLLMELLRYDQNILPKYKSPGTLHGKYHKLRLVVVLDTAFDISALEEAHMRNIPSIALVNHHNPLAPVTFPVYARSGHPGYIHFFLNWLLKVVNVLPEEPRGDLRELEGEEVGGVTMKARVKGE